MSEPAATLASRLAVALSWIERHLAHLAALFAAAFLLATRTQPIRTNWGDAWSDLHVQTSGRYFAETGFVRNRFTPVIDVGPLKPDSLLYTHYPPLPNLINGLQQWLFGPVDVSTFRILADVLALGSLFFFHRIVRSMWGARTAGYALALLVTNLLWLQYADTIHHVPIYWFSGFGALYAGVRWLETGRRTLLAWVAAACLVCMISSYDYAFFVPVLMVSAIGVKGLGLRDRRAHLLVAALVVGVVAGVLLKLGLVAWAVGPQTLVADLVFQLEERATAKHSVAYKAGLVPILFWRLVRFFSPVSFVVFGVQLVALAWKLFKKHAGAVSAGPLVLLAAGLPFLLVFTQLFVEQVHPTLQLLPYYAVGTAAVLVAMRAQARPAWNAAAFGVFVFLVGWQTNEIVSFKKTFLDREDIHAVEHTMRGTPDHDFILTNTLLDFPAVGFYLHRYPLGAYFPDRAATLAYLGKLFDELGDDRPIRFLEMTGVSDMVFDKMVYGVFAGEARWSWISRPAYYRSEWQPVAKERATVSATLFRELGTLELTTDTMRLYRVEASALEAYYRSLLPPGETRAIDFGAVESNLYKVAGLRYPEREAGIGFSWTTARQRQRLRMTMKGVVFVPDGPKRYDASLRVVITPARDRRLVLRVLSFEPGQSVEVSVNGRAVGAAPVTAEWSDVSFVIPAAALVPEPIQVINLRSAKGSAYDVGIAVSSAHIDAP